MSEWAAKGARWLLFAAALFLVVGVACRQAAAPAAPTAPAAPVGPKEPVKVDVAKMTEYFKGKTVELFIGYAPGGGYDIKGRLFVEYFCLLSSVFCLIRPSTARPIPFRAS
jgi:hypothetical protein